MTGVINRDAFKATPRELRFVPTPTWTGEGTGVYVRGFKVGERIQLEEIATDESKTEKQRGFESMLHMAVMTVVDEDGTQLLTDDVLEAMVLKDPAVLVELNRVALELSGISTGALAAAADQGVDLTPKAGESGKSRGKARGSATSGSPASG